MSEILLITTMIVSSICVIVFLVIFKLTNSKQQELNNSCSRVTDAESTISNLDIIIETSVTSINQKMVSTLKENNGFVQSDKEEAFNECKKMVYSMTGNKTLEALECLGMDADAWINARIEYFVRKHKST